mmetsp:Transcript_85368/g.134256  ORF Transcript_85368/g.134256 Transcript_85368/m.134256 type:complete len:462 (-) Transcript_85368:251-1636(-)
MVHIAEVALVSGTVISVEPPMRDHNTVDELRLHVAAALHVAVDQITLTHRTELLCDGKLLGCAIQDADNIVVCATVKFRLIQAEGHPSVRVFAEPTVTGTDLFSKVRSGEQCDFLGRKGDRVEIDCGAVTGWVGSKNLVPSLQLHGRQLQVQQAEGRSTVRVVSHCIRGSELVAEIPSGSDVCCIEACGDFVLVHFGGDGKGWVEQEDLPAPATGRLGGVDLTRLHSGRKLTGASGYTGQSAESDISLDASQDAANYVVCTTNKVRLIQAEGHPSIRVFEKPIGIENVQVGEVRSGEQCDFLGRQGDLVEIKCGTLKGWVGSKNVLPSLQLHGRQLQAQQADGHSMVRVLSHCIRGSEIVAEIPSGSDIYGVEACGDFVLVEFGEAGKGWVGGKNVLGFQQGDLPPPVLSLRMSQRNFPLPATMRSECVDLTHLAGNEMKDAELRRSVVTSSRERKELNWF